MKNENGVPGTPAVLALCEYLACAEDNGWTAEYTLSQLKLRLDGKTGSQMHDDSLSALAPLMRVPDPPETVTYVPRIIHGGSWYQLPVACGDIQDAVRFEDGIFRQIVQWRAGGSIPTSDFSMRPWSIGEISQELERLGWVRQGYASHS